MRRRQRMVWQVFFFSLKHWRQDMMAALVVALVSVPLSLRYSARVRCTANLRIDVRDNRGLVFPFLGGAYVTICGPAAGLAPVLSLQ